MTEEAYSPQEIALSQAVGAQVWTFMKGVVDLEGLPPGDRPEIAFAGRSNVGKSSLINALTNQSGLARTSNTPGRTQEINFFETDPERDAGLLGDAYLVDLPGYGYAKAPKQKVAAWTYLILDYLRGRPNLKRVFVLIDARHGLKDNDRDVLDLLDESAVSYLIILTKLDKLTKAEQDKVVTKTRDAVAKRVAAFPDIAATSAQKNWGLDDARLKAAQAILI